MACSRRYSQSGPAGNSWVPVVLLRQRAHHALSEQARALRLRYGPTISVLGTGSVVDFPLEQFSDSESGSDSTAAEGSDPAGARQPAFRHLGWFDPSVLQF